MLLDCIGIYSPIALEHHERWDGSAYPRGLKAEEINIVARIVTIADVFDALNHDRCYKKAWPLEKSIKFIEDNSGKTFFRKCWAIFKCKRQYTDNLYKSEEIKGSNIT